jgi:tryptophan-rich hypothetical protein
MNYKKLLNSKWTAVTPQKKEKHFSVIKVVKNSEDPQIIDTVILEAVLTGKSYNLNPQELKNRNLWQEGWK